VLAPVGWVKDIESTQNCTVNYPIVADPDRTVAETYGMIHPNSPLTMAGKLTVRTVWIIDPNNKVRLNLTYPAATGTLLFSRRCVSRVRHVKLIIWTGCMQAVTSTR
jgi:alkyl hydroperoxide reductase subunit AhpC